MAIDRDKIRAFLQDHYLFKTLEAAVFEKVAARAGIVACQPQKEILQAGASARYFSIVFSGKLVSEKKHTDKTQAETWILSDSDCFGYEALSESPLTSPGSVTAIEQSILVVFNSDDILSLAKEHQELKQIFGLLLRSHKLQQKKHPHWRNPDEQILYLTRRHISDLYTGLISPAIVTVLGYLIVLIIFNLLPKPASPAIFDWSLLVAGVCLFWAIYNVVDWCNDYYAFTNQRVLSLEKVAFFYESRHELPLEAVQSISTSTELFGRMMTFGNISIRTYTGMIDFPHIEAPQMIINLVENYLEKIRNRHELEQNRRIEQTIRHRIQSGSQYPSSVIPDLKPEQQTGKISAKKQGFLISLFRLKEVSGETITYRTHWFILIAKTILPLLLFIATLGTLIFRLVGYLSKIPFEIAFIGAAILFLSAFIWWLYEYIDWRNDVYIITPDQLIDINRRPLGHEERRSAPLKNIQTIEYKRLGIFGLLFNFGTVFIRVGDTELTFDYVSDPSSVQKELFERFMRFSQEEKRIRAEQENERMAAWIESYHRVIADHSDQDEAPDHDQFSV